MEAFQDIFVLWNKKKKLKKFDVSSLSMQEYVKKKKLF